MVTVPGMGFAGLAPAYDVGCAYAHEDQADDRSKWRMVTENDFLENEARGRAKESAFFSMILVSDDAKHNDALYRRMSNAFTLAAFLTFFGKLDLARSREGVCGR